MLLEFGVKNFACFKEGASISFKLDANCPRAISKGRKFTPVLGVMGANGSGKTHILKGLTFMSVFCTGSFTSKPEDGIGIDAFYGNDGPTELFAEFSINEILYRYELSATRKEIRSECLYRTTDKKTKVIERVGNEFTTLAKDYSRLSSIKLRKNASLISTAHQYEFDELSDVYNFFNYIVSNVTYSGLLETPNNINNVAEYLHGHKRILNFVNKFIAKCDVGISKIDVVKTEGKEGKPKFIPVFRHEVKGKLYPVTHFTESSGTKALFRNLPSYELALNSGGLLILDEFDNHLHPHILPKLLELFLDAKVNKKHAQLIFSTHDSEILNLLGRYRTYLVNKEENESYTYRLDEIPGDILRNDRPIRPAYKDGKIGGVPRL